jgi:predicted HicB family RNase H-like nuclease
MHGKIGITYINMNDKKCSVIRVKPEVHRVAKIAACEKLLTLQSWVEQLIEKECKLNK